MSEGGLEPRVASLENQVKDLRAKLKANEHDAAAARILAGAADRDVGEITTELRDFRRATIASLNAMREDAVGQQEALIELTQEMRTKFDLATAGQQQIVGMLATLIDRGN